MLLQSLQSKTFSTWFFTRRVRAPRVTGLRLSFVDVAFEVADHVSLSGDGDRTNHTVVMSHMSS